MLINTCVLGYGLSARTFQIPYILLTPGLHLHSILQRTLTADLSAATDFPGIKIHPSIGSVCADPEIRLVVVSTSNASHFLLTKSLLEAGKDVIVEKPFTVTAVEAGELVELAKGTGRVLTVFQNRRWDADFLTLRRLLSEGTFGTLVSLESHFDRFKSWSSPTSGWKTQPVPGNGVLYDLGAHLVDQALVLFGVPDRVCGSVRDERGVSGEGTRYGDHGFLDDTFDVLLYYDRKIKGIQTPKRGFVVKLSASATSLCEKQVRFIVRGSEAGWVKQGLDLQEDQTKAGMGPEDERFGVETEEMWGVLSTPEGESRKVQSERGCYRRFLENVIAVLEGREELEVTAEQAADVVKVLEFAGRSEREGRVLGVPKK